MYANSNVCEIRTGNEYQRGDGFQAEITRRAGCGARMAGREKASGAGSGHREKSIHRKSRSEFFKGRNPGDKKQ